MDPLATARQLIAEVEQEQPGTFELACLASFAVRVDPPLLRRLRLELLPDSSPAIEADLWLGSLVTFRSPEGFVFAKGVASLLRERLAERGEELYERAWRITQESHVWLNRLLRVEEELNYLQFSRASDASERARTQLRSILAALDQERGSGIGHWAVGASARLPRELLALEEGAMLVSAARASLQGSLVSPAPPPEGMSGGMAWIAQEYLERVRIGVKLFPGYVELGFDGKDPESSLEVPRTAPLVVEVAEPAEETSAGGRRVFISYSRREDSRLREQIAQALRSAHHEVIGEGSFSPGESLLSVVREQIRQSDAAVLLVSEGSLSNEWNSQEARALLEKKYTEGDRFPLILVYLKPASPDMLSRRWPEARALLLFQGIVEDASDIPRITAQILAALERSSERVKSWQWLEFHPSRPRRIALQAGRVHLRTLLGDEYIIEPKEPASILQMPPPDPEFVGYEQELADLLSVGIGRGIPFILVYGPSGAGKTAFVLQLADLMVNDFPDGRFYVERRQGGPPLSARAVAREVLRALDPRASQDSRDVLERYREQALRRRFLLVLDGLKGLSADDGLSESELASLIPGGTGSLLMVTAQQNVSQELRASPGWRQELSGLNPTAIMELLRRFAPRVGEDAEMLAEVCGRLPGPLRQVAGVLAQRPDISVRDYVSLLDSARMLSVFPGTFDYEAALAVVDPEFNWNWELSMGKPRGLMAEVTRAMKQARSEAQLVAELVRFGLIQAANDPGRFVLWHPVRQVAEAEPDWPEIRSAGARHSSHFAEVLEHLEEKYREGGTARTEAIATFELEWPNMDVGFNMSLVRARGGEEEGRVYVELIRQYSLAAGSLMRLLCPPRDREYWHGAALDVTTEEQTGYAAHLLGHARALVDLGRVDDAITDCEMLLDVFDDSPDVVPSVDVYLEFARLYVDAGRWKQARETHEAVALGLKGGTVNPHHQVAQLRYVSACLDRQAGRLDSAEREFETARGWAASAADVRLEVDALLGLAGVAADEEKRGIAGARYIQALDFARDYRDARGVALGSWEFGRLRASEGLLDVAREFMQRLVDYRRSIGHVQAESTAQEMERILSRARSRGPARRLVGSLIPHIQSVFRGHGGCVTVARFSPDGERVLTASSNEAATRIWDADSGHLLSEFQENAGAIQTARFSPDGRLVLTASADGSAILWEGVAGQFRARFVIYGHPGPVNEARFSPDGWFIITASDYEARLCNAKTGAPLTDFIGHSGAVTDARFSLDGRYVLTASDDRTARLWDVTSGRPLAELRGHSDAVWMARFSPDGRRVLTASVDATARLWSVTSGQPLAEYRGHLSQVYSARFSPDGTRVITASDDGTACIWHTDSGQRLLELREHSGPVFAAHFSPDGLRVITASEDGIARLWDVATGEPLAELRGDFNAQTPVCFSPDGQRILTANTDGVARLWTLR